MNVLTYNVHGWQTPTGEPNLDLLAEVIGASGADVVGLNEVFFDEGRPLLQTLAARLGMNWAFGATQPADPDKHPPYGNAVLSRWPILAHAAHHLSPAVSYGKRGLLEARLLPPDGRAITVYVTHLDHRSEETRIAQWSSAHAWLARDRDRLHLLLGDFNALAETDYPDAAALDKLSAYQAFRGWPAPTFDLMARILKAGYVDAFATAGAGGGATYPSHAPERRIDYIFVPQPWRERLHACAPFSRSPVLAASDHLPVLAHLDL